MDRQASRADRLVDALGALAAGLGAGASAWLGATAYGLSPPFVAGVCGVIGAAMGWLVMRSVAPAPALAIVPFDTGTIEFEEDLDVLLLDNEADVLLLEDELLELEPDARVVRLFAPDVIPSPGQLSAQIDRHLLRSETPSDDATAALHAALHDIRRTLNRR